MRIAAVSVRDSVALVIAVVVLACLVSAPSAHAVPATDIVAPSCAPEHPDHGAVHDDPGRVAGGQSTVAPAADVCAAPSPPSVHIGLAGDSRPARSPGGQRILTDLCVART